MKTTKMESSMQMLTQARENAKKAREVKRNADIIATQALTVDKQVTKRLTLDYMLRTDEGIQAWKDTIIKNYEDSTQEWECLKYEQLAHLIERINQGKLILNRRITEDTSERIQIDHIEELTFLELFSLTCKSVKRDFIRYLHRFHSSINNMILTDVDSEDEDGAKNDLFNLIEDKAQAEQLKAIDFVESLRSILSKTQFEHVQYYLTNNKWKNEHNSKIKNKIKQAMEESGDFWESRTLEDKLYKEENSVRLTATNIKNTIERYR
jgi:hypothetical protein